MPMVADLDNNAYYLTNKVHDETLRKMDHALKEIAASVSHGQPNLLAKDYKLSRELPK